MRGRSIRRRCEPPASHARRGLLVAAHNAAARATLSRRERAVLALLRDGRANDEIAAELRISPRTVEGHRTRLGRKLHLRSRAELVEYACIRASRSVILAAAVRDGELMHECSPSCFVHAGERARRALDISGESTDSQSGIATSLRNSFGWIGVAKTRSRGMG